ncbi:type II toxin-antitoxin system HicB family antitoxin [Nocardiopsis tropica]|uniref:Type II toxin-antitoxin system HicB family antitoxin n=1 Tax=Nocardiopsis tropica TaxID=109330 RepID=A0ABV1ZY73_9ACTN|nr:type II toxin-antitoxin system HicB family antitoxin [Nocardiopsis umidischolae]MEE2053708.1 type II toxin-antitoxin system HicB family antitoxin [Nocardiopsis umidischolae]
MSEHHYRARCEKDGRHWSVDVPELRLHTFGATLADAEDMARDAIAGVLDVPVDRVSVDLVVQGAEELQADLAAARSERAAAEEHMRTAQARAVEALLAKGASQRDTARLLGMSHQRVSQVAAGSSAVDA